MTECHALRALVGQLAADLEWILRLCDTENDAEFHHTLKVAIPAQAEAAIGAIRETLARVELVPECACADRVAARPQRDAEGALDARRCQTETALSWRVCDLDMAETGDTPAWIDRARETARAAGVALRASLGASE